MGHAKATGEATQTLSRPSQSLGPPWESSGLRRLQGPTISAHSTRYPTMSRHKPTPFHADPRLNRRHIDLLPTHRQCPRCTKVLLLDALHFYEDRNRHAWNLSRYGTTCKPCSIQADAERRASRRPVVNAQARQRSALLKSNMRTAAYVYSSQWKATKEQNDAAAADRKTRMAWARRQLNRLRGPYVDPVKALIRANQAAAAEKRRTSHEDAAPPEPMNAEQRDHLALLEALRAKHHLQAGTVSNP